MTKLKRLLNILLNEIISEEKKSVRENLTYCLCTHSISGVNPNEIDADKTYIKSQDDKRYYVSVTMKNGTKLTVPLEKRYARDGRYSKLGVCS